VTTGEIKYDFSFLMYRFLLFNYRCVLKCNKLLHFLLHEFQMVRKFGVSKCFDDDDNSFLSTISERLLKGHVTLNNEQ